MTFTDKWMATIGAASSMGALSQLPSSLTASPAGPIVAVAPNAVEEDLVAAAVDLKWCHHLTLLHEPS
jgi:hypothetical protein